MPTVVSVVPLVIDALIAGAQDALGEACLVVDGFGLTDDPGNFLMIGVEDPDTEDFATSATSVQEWAHAVADERDETGDVSCAALAWNGDGDQKAARDAAYDIVTGFGTWIRENYTLGLANVYNAEFGSNQALTQIQNTDGAVALVSFKVAFKARI